MTRTFAEVVDAIPARGVGPQYKGSWVGFFLRAAFSPFIGYENARRLVIDACGPGHDYYCRDSKPGRAYVVPR